MNKIPTTQKPASTNDSPPLLVPPKNLRILFAVHAVLTSAAGIVLIAAPALIPGAVGIRLDRGAYLVCYLLAAAEFSIAVLSWGARNISDAKALRIILAAFMVFHAASGVLEIYAVAEGGAISAAIWGNVAARAVICFLFAYFGLYKIPKDAARV